MFTVLQIQTTWGTLQLYTKYKPEGRGGWWHRPGDYDVNLFTYQQIKITCGTFVNNDMAANDSVTAYHQGLFAKTQ